MSPFLDSTTIRPLYDVHEGGAPKAFLCVIFCHTIPNGWGYCNNVTRTYKGMIDHLRFKHGITLQEEIAFDEIKPTT